MIWAIYGNIHGHIIHVVPIQVAALRSPIPLGLDGRIKSHGLRPHAVGFY